MKDSNKNKDSFNHNSVNNSTSTTHPP